MKKEKGCCGGNGLGRGRGGGGKGDMWGKGLGGIGGERAGVGGTSRENVRVGGRGLYGGEEGRANGGNVGVLEGMFKRNVRGGGGRLK